MIDHFKSCVRACVCVSDCEVVGVSIATSVEL